jgi:hypothetical protein
MSRYHISLYLNNKRSKLAYFRMHILWCFKINAAINILVNKSQVLIQLIILYILILCYH